MKKNVCMFHGRKLNKRINKVHERSLRLVYKDYKATFERLLGKDNYVKIYQKNLQLLATEIIKVRNDLARNIMKTVSQFKNPFYNLRSDANIFLSQRIRKTTYHGLNSIKYLDPKIWDQIPENMKNCGSLKSFKQLIKIWVQNLCPCRLCKKYIAQAGSHLPISLLT